jgi:hypothetical protein
MCPCIKCWQATIIAAILDKADMAGGEAPTNNVAQRRQVSNHLERRREKHILVLNIKNFVKQLDSPQKKQKH